MDMFSDIKKAVSEAVIAVAPDVHNVVFSFKTRREEGFGDYSTNVAFLLAEHMHLPPEDIAQDLAEHITKNLPTSVDHVDVAGKGFVNFFITDKAIYHALESFNPKNPELREKKTVILEYSSVNIAKPMHVGHLRATILGDVLANLHDYVGNRVIRWNHLGDWGTQFGKLIVAYKQWGNKKEVEKDPITQLLALYVRFHKEAENNPELEKQAREEFKKLEQHDKENMRLFKWFTKESMQVFEKTYRLLDVNFDVQKGESEYIDIAREAIGQLIKAGVAHESEGAIVVDCGNDMPPALLEKEDGSTLYLTRDLALLIYRASYKPDKVLYIVGSEQNLHFRQLAILASIWNNHNFDPHLPAPKHIAFGLVLGEDGKKLSTRDGRVVQAQELIDSFLSFANTTVREKHPSLSISDQKKIAQATGIGAIRYAMVKDDRTSNIKLNMEAAFSMKGNSATYLQYTYARLSGILNKISSHKKADASNLESSDMPLTKMVLQFHNAVTRSLDASSPHHLAEYCFDLANSANSFYERSPIVSDTDIKRRDARLLLVKKVKETLATGLAILGIETPETI